MQPNGFPFGMENGVNTPNDGSSCGPSIPMSSKMSSA